MEAKILKEGHQRKLAKEQQQPQDAVFEKIRPEEFAKTSQITGRGGEQFAHLVQQLELIAGEVRFSGRPGQQAEQPAISAKGALGLFFKEEQFLLLLRQRVLEIRERSLGV